MNFAWLAQVGDDSPHINVWNLHPYYEVRNDQSLKLNAFYSVLMIVMMAHYMCVCFCLGHVSDLMVKSGAGWN